MYVVIYLAALVVANLSAAHFGPAATPLIGFVLIGLDLTLRDRLHDQWHGQGLWLRMLGLIAAAGAISYALNPASGSIALASVAAFTLASLADAAVYQALASRPWLTRTNGSNIVGAAVDSLIFPVMAFGALLPSIVLAQMAAKIAGGMIWAMVIGRFVATKEQAA